mmetsp:Transcript_17230/g.36430  ORF Transcript_17230/g.36430 Transcript_17230/m.36430 type:complete len:466 (+) Transcript_17230:122-1519(+)
MHHPTAEQWKFILPEVSRQDPTPLLLQSIYLILSIAAYIPILFPISFSIHVLGYDESHLSFDKNHLPPADPNISSLQQFTSNFFTLLRRTTGLSSTTLSICVALTMGFYAILLWLDITTDRRPFPWPKSWHTENNICYDEMFGEPSRKDRVIRRLGNTLSNFFYLFLSLVVLTSTVASSALGRGEAVGDSNFPILTGFVISDAIFGGMLFTLSLASTTWHGCNALWSHVVDLWSMEAVILYFPIRIVSSAIFSMLLKWNYDLSISSLISTTVCIAVYLTHIVINGKRFYSEHKMGFWREMCPVSVRIRLPNSPRVLRKEKDDKYRGNYYIKPIGILEVYLFALMPVFQNVPSWALSRSVFHSIGSVCMVRVVNTTLTVGWIYRLLERWALDGCRLLHFCEKKIRAAERDGGVLGSSFWTVVAAVVSPTAALHFWTGITLIAGYCHARSLEISVLMATANQRADSI